jgi:hypothetical protein
MKNTQLNYSYPNTILKQDNMLQERRLLDWLKKLQQRAPLSVCGSSDCVDDTSEVSDSKSLLKPSLLDSTTGSLSPVLHCGKPSTES